MLRFRLATILTVLASAVVLAQQASKDDKDKLQGTWKLVSGEARGEQMPAEAVGRLKLVFKADKVIVYERREPMALDCTLNPSASPKTIDLFNPAEKQGMAGIYQLDGDTLKLCLGERGSKDRPTAFAGTKDTKNALLVFERAKGDDVVKVTDEEVKELRGALSRRTSANNLRQLGIAMHNYHNDYARMPFPAIYSKDGKPLLSWRVAVLPYIEQDNLYKQFNLEEPWDSEHNKPLLAKMPRVFGPIQMQAKEPNSTFYRVFVSAKDAKPSALFTENGKITLGQIAVQDGTSNTLMIVEAGEAVPWTKPEELLYANDKPLPKLGGLFAEGFNACFADCSVQFFKKEIYADEKVLRALITRDGNETVDFRKYVK